MKRILLLITGFIFCMNIYSSQVEFKEYRTISLSELNNVDYQVILRSDTDGVILIMIDGEILYINYDN